MFVNNEEMVVGAVSTAMIGFGGLALRKIAAKAAPTVGLALAAVAAPAALFVMPQAALADNECVIVGEDPSDNDATADNYDCDQASYADGVTYTADGDLTVNFINAGSPARSIIGDTGVSLSAAGTDGIAVDSTTTATELQSDGTTTGPLLGVTTIDGNIDIDVEEIDADASASGVTHGISAESMGAGGIDINTTGTVDAASGSNPDTSIGIEAITNSGDIVVTTGGFVSGNQYGIRAESGGALTINTSDNVSIDSTLGLAAINATTTGTDDLAINILSTGATDPVDGQNGSAVLADAGGDMEINIGTGRTVTSDSTSATGAMNLTAVGETVVNNAGQINGGSFTSQGTAVRATGNGFILNNNDGGDIRGSLDFSGLAGGYTFNNNAGAIWNPAAGVNDFGAVGVLNNAGTINLRGSFRADRIGTDVNRVVSAPGSTFTGTGDSTLEYTVFLNGTTQTDCANPTVTSCLDLRSGTTTGQTKILIDGAFTTLITGSLTAVTSANPGAIVLVDVGGGTSEADHFVLHPDSILVQGDDGRVETAAYAEDPVYGAVLDTSVLGMGGIFDYALLYNPDTRQHLLASVPQPQAIEYVSFIRQAMSVWHSTTDTVVGRQAALRGGATGKLWFRVTGGRTEYDAAPSFTTQGNTFVYDQQYSVDTRALIAGLDLISDDDRVLGVHGGIVSLQSTFDDTGTDDEGEGVTVGLYGGWWHDSGLSLDGAVNLNSLTLDHTVSGDLESGDSDFRALGVRVEAGWRLPLMAEALYVQPLATAAYVVADFDDVDLRDNGISFEGTDSSRAGLGARLGGAVNLNHDMIGRLGYWLTARAWEEYADEGEARFATRDGSHLSLMDDRSGTFEEVDFGVNVSNQEGNLNVHLSGGVQSGDEIDNSYNVSVGARLNW